MTAAQGERAALLAAAFVGVQVGAATVASRFAVAEVAPATLAMLRYAIAVACLVPFLARLGRGAWPFAGRDLAPMAVLGILQFGVLIALYNYGLKTMPAARAALLLATFPLQTLVIAALLGRERLTGMKGAGVLLGLAGVAVALSDKLAAGSVGGDVWLGTLAVLAAALSGSLSSVLCRPYLMRYPALPVGAYQMGSAVLFLSALAALEGSFSGGLAAQPAAWGAIGFIGLSSGAGYVAWLWALARTTPTRVTIFLCLSPVTAIILGQALLGETVTTTVIAGLVLVSAGVWLVTRGSAQAPAAAK